jgi:uncharacterized tellurite resistance protein B-like protein
MENKIQKSVAVLLAHIIKVDNRDVEKEAPLFCKLLQEDFECNQEDAQKLLEEVLESEYDLNAHLDIINAALRDDKISKMHLMEQLNHIIYSDTIQPQDYEAFEAIRQKFFGDEA